jgi:hypothetical protein
MTRKITAIMLAVLLIVPFALVPSVATGTMTVSCSGATVAVGGGGNLTLSVDDNPGIMGLVILLSYDKTALSLGAVSNGDVFESVSKAEPSNGTRITAESSENTYEDGILTVIPVVAASDAAAGDYTINVTVVDAYDENLDNVSVTAASFAVHVVVDLPEVTFTAGNVEINAANVGTYRQTDGSFIVPVSVTASGIDEENGVAALSFGISTDSDVYVSSITAGSAIPTNNLAHHFQVSEDNKVVAWVDTNEITAQNAQIAVIDIAIPHDVDAGDTFGVTLTPSDDPDDYLLIDVTNYSPIFAAGTISFAVSGHVAGNAVRENEVAVSCTVDGGYDEVVYCTVCGEELSRAHTTISAPGHVAGEAVRENEVAVSCTTAGGYDEVVYCTVCGEELSRTSVVIPALGHSYSTQTVLPTCTAAGYTLHTCTRCGDHYTSDEVPANGHSFGDWVIVNEVSCTENGLKRRECSVCHETEEEVITAPGHNYVDFICTVCGKRDPNAPIDPQYLPQIVVSSAECAAGEQVQVTLSLANNPGIAGMALSFAPQAPITIASATNCGMFSGFTYSRNLVLDSDDNVTEDGAFAVFTINVPEGTEPGDYEIAIIVRECFNIDYDEVELIVPSIVITVSEPASAITYGDANGDGQITSRDILSIRQYLANYDYETETSTVEVFPGADANGDGSITSRDILIIRQYLANYDYETGTSTVVLGPQG